MGRKRTLKADKGGWKVTFEDGETVETGYYPNPRMAVAVALKEKCGKPSKVKSVNWMVKNG